MKGSSYSDKRLLSPLEKGQMKREYMFSKVKKNFANKFRGNDNIWMTLMEVSLIPLLKHENSLWI